MFARAMAAADSLSFPSVLADVDWAVHRRELDIGGSLGTVLAGLLQAHPHMRGVLFDLPPVIDEARTHWAARHSGLLERVELVGGSFFEVVPPGEDGDVYVMRVVLHDWADEDVVRILKRVREAIGDADARLKLVELVLGERETVTARLLLDLHMLVNFSSRERTEREWRRVIEAAGFRIDRVYPTRSLYSVVDCVPDGAGDLPTST